MSTTATLDTTVAARDVEIVCCQDCCPTWNLRARTPKATAPSPEFKATKLATSSIAAGVSLEAKPSTPDHTAKPLHLPPAPPKEVGKKLSDVVMKAIRETKEAE